MLKLHFLLWNDCAFTYHEILSWVYQEIIDYSKKLGKEMVKKVCMKEVLTWSNKSEQIADRDLAWHSTVIKRTINWRRSFEEQLLTLENYILSRHYDMIFILNWLKIVAWVPNSECKL